MLVEDNDEEEEPKYESIPNPLLKESIISVACGGAHTLLLTQAHQVFSFGSNDEGALGRKGHEAIPGLVILNDSV